MERDIKSLLYVYLAAIDQPYTSSISIAMDVCLDACVDDGISDNAEDGSIPFA